MQQKNDRMDLEQPPTIPDVDEKKADIFSFGIVIYECFFRSQPNHKNFSSQDISFKHYYQNEPSLLKYLLQTNARFIEMYKNCGQKVDMLLDLIIRMTKIDPSERPSAKEIVAHPFFKD